MKKIQLIMFFFTCTISLFGQAKVETAIQLLQSDMIGAQEVEVETLGNWLKPIFEQVETFFKDEKGGEDVLVLISLFPEEETRFQIASRPEIPKEQREQLKKILQKNPTLNSNFMPYTLAVLASVNDGYTGAEMEYSPMPVFPEQEWSAKFVEADLAGKKKLLQDWAKDGLIPLVANFKTNVNDEFLGVLGVGELMKNQVFLKKPVVEITEQNHTYWRAVMEMELGNQVIPFSKICMHLANGEFDQAGLLLSVIHYFDQQKMLSNSYYDLIKGSLDLFQKTLAEEIQKGIALHDQGKYQEALDLYNDLHKIQQNSAWLNYEIYLSSVMIAGQDKATEIWSILKPKIYASNPMYEMMAVATNGAEGYELYRRREINDLLQSEKNTITDLVAYADIALDLKAYGFAAQMYWYIFHYIEKKDYDNRNILAHYLYCLDKLGDTESIKNFKGDFKKEFKQIEKERRELMEKSSIYQSMED